MAATEQHMNEAIRAATRAATEQHMPPAAGPCAAPRQPVLAPTHLPLVVPFSAMALLRAAAVSLERAAGEFLAAVAAHPHAPPAPRFGGPRSASPQDQQQRQVKARLGPDDGMEEELRQPESAATQLHMQNASAFEDPAADQQQQQPNQQTHQLAVVPFERDASEGPGACSPLAAVGLKKREARRQHKLLMEQLDAEEREARAAERGADAPMPPAMPCNTSMQQPAPQTQPAPKKQPKQAQQPAPKKQTQPQAPKQPQRQQTPKQPAQQQTFKP